MDLGNEILCWKACVQETTGKHWDRDSRERPEQERSRIPRRDWLVQTKVEDEKEEDVSKREGVAL